MLDMSDFGANPHAPEFGGLGVCYVRYGKAMKGSPPQRRSVLTVWPWVAEVLAVWATLIRPLQGPEGNPALWPTERAPRISVHQIDHLFAACRGRARPGRRAGFPFAAPLVCHPPDRRRVGSAVRPAAGRPTGTPPPPPSTRACRRTSAPGPCAGHWMPRWTPRSPRRGGISETPRGLPVAPAGSDGMARSLNSARRGLANISSSHDNTAVLGVPPAMNLCQPPPSIEDVPTLAYPRNTSTLSTFTSTKKNPGGLATQSLNPCSTEAMARPVHPGRWLRAWSSPCDTPGSQAR